MKCIPNFPIKYFKKIHVVFGIYQCLNINLSFSPGKNVGNIGFNTATLILLSPIFLERKNMPRHSKYSPYRFSKVTPTKRKDGSNRYRISLPKDIGDSKEKQIGVFTYHPKNKEIIFDLRPDLEYYNKQLAKEES